MSVEEVAAMLRAPADGAYRVGQTFGSSKWHGHTSHYTCFCVNQMLPAL